MVLLMVSPVTGKSSRTTGKKNPQTLGMDAATLARAADEARRAASAETAGLDRRFTVPAPTAPHGGETPLQYDPIPITPMQVPEDGKMQRDGRGRRESGLQDEGLDVTYDSSVDGAEEGTSGTFPQQPAGSRSTFADARAASGHESATPATVYRVPGFPGATFDTPQAAAAAQAVVDRMAAASAKTPAMGDMPFGPPLAHGSTPSVPAATSGYTGPSTLPSYTETGAAATTTYSPFAPGPTASAHLHPYGGSHHNAAGHTDGYGAIPATPSSGYPFGTMPVGPAPWISGLPSIARENLKMKLASHEREYRARKNPSWATCVDDGSTMLSPYRLAPHSHINPERLFRVGLDFACQDAAPPLPHDLSHVKSGTMIDARAFMLASSLTEPLLDLSRFRPGTFLDPASDKPLASMGDTLRAWNCYRMLVRRARPWDLSNEVVTDYIYECELFMDESKIYGGYYRSSDHPPYKAVLDLIMACHSTLIRLLPIRPGMLTHEKVDEIHRQRCAEMPSAWTTAHPSLRHDSARGDRHVATRERRQRKQQSKAGPNVRAETKRIKDACRVSSVPTCQAFNLGLPCTRQMNAAGTACLFTKAGVPPQELAHTCPYMAAGGPRCGLAHAMATAH